MANNNDFFRVKKPCRSCPFRKDVLKGWLGSPRAASIIKDLQEKSFSCHKTVDHDAHELDDFGDVPEKRDIAGEAFCAGAIILQEKEYENRSGGIGRPLQLGERLGLYKKDEYSGQELIFDTAKQFIEHHKTIGRN